MTGMNNSKYDTKGQSDTERKIVAYQDLSDNTEISVLNRTDQSTLSNIDSVTNYMSSKMSYINIRYFDDHHFRDKLNSNQNVCFIYVTGTLGFCWPGLSYVFVLV